MSDSAAHAEARAAYMRRVAIVKDRLRQDALRIAREIAPGGDPRGSRYHACSPFRNDSDNQSAFSIYISGPKAGGWIDFVSGEKGDLVQLLMARKGLAFKEVIEWAEDRYGLRHVSPERRAELSREAEKREARDKAVAEAKRLRNIQSACHMFSQAVPDITGTPVERYLASRGIELGLLPNRDRRWLRFHPAATYWMDPARPKLPAMIAGMVDGQGVMRAIHLTFLRRDGQGKADVKCKTLCHRSACQRKGCMNSPKLMWPDVMGLVIRLNHGKPGIAPEAAINSDVRGPLMLCEGIEDGLSIAMGDPDLRVWAASSLSNLMHVPDHPCASSYVVAQDNDWGKAAAAAGFKAALKHLRSFNKPVVAVRSTTGKDFNDQLKGQDHEPTA